MMPYVSVCCHRCVLFISLRNLPEVRTLGLTSVVVVVLVVVAVVVN